LRQGVQGISDIITIPGVINRDFADVKTTMAGMGYAVMGTATGMGENRAMDAAIAAMASPLLEAGAIDGARGILINITGSSNLKLSEVNEASTIIQNAAHEDCNIIFGAVQDERLGDEVKITVIATGFKQEMPERRARMLAEATMPGADFQVPIRAQHGRGAQALFASEEREGRQVAVQRPVPMPETGKAEEPFRMESRIETEPERQGWAEPDEAAGWAEDAVEEEMAPELEFAPEAEAVAEPVEDAEGKDLPEMAAVGRRAEPELVPVPASVFDDDFFRAGAAHGEPSGTAYGYQDPAASEARVFAGVASHAGSGEVDELDIPAFLRRSR